MEPILLELDWPPSVNRYYRRWGSRMLLSKPAREYRQLVASSVREASAKRMLKGRLKVRILCHPPTAAKWDLDNRCKGILDSLEHSGVFVNDSQVDDLHIIRGPVQSGGMVVVEISEIK